MIVINRNESLEQLYGRGGGDQWVEGFQFACVNAAFVSSLLTMRIVLITLLPPTRNDPVTALIVRPLSKKLDSTSQMSPAKRSKSCPNFEDPPP